MTGIPDKTAIALWIAGSCWAVALLLYVFNGPSDLVLPLLLFGAATGIVEWILTRMEP
jgi:hypothetical protein